jgi:hypothetical protein
MTMVLQIAFVTETEYPLLADACADGVVGQNYAEFMKWVDMQFETLKKVGYEPIRVHINPTDFATWCGNRKATRKDLVRYAELVCKSKFDQNDPSRKTAAPPAPPPSS